MQNDKIIKCSDIMRQETSNGITGFNFLLAIYFWKFTLP